MLTDTFALSLQAGTSQLRIPMSQHDKRETLKFKLIHKATSADISSGVTAEINGRKPNGKGFTHSVTYSYSNGVGNATVTVLDDMTDVAGDVICEITLTKGSGANEKRLSSANFVLEIEDSPNEDWDDLLPATPTLYYYSYDGSTLLYSETVSSGSDGSYSGTPTRQENSQYSYTFVGWNWNMNSTTADRSSTKNVLKNRNVYAAYSVTTKKYTVTFKNSDNTLLQTVSNVPYGGTANYTNGTPSYPDGDPMNIGFDGFSPTGSNITGDTVCVAQYSSMSVSETSIGDTWSEIFASEDDGSYISKYTIGNLKTLQIGNYVYHAQIVAINGDILSNNSGRAKITWVLKELYSSAHKMNSSATNKNGWGATNMRSWLSSSVLPQFPSDVRGRIKEVKKTYYDFTSKSTLTANDKLWIPSRRELGANEFDWDTENSGVIYDVFSLLSFRKKQAVNYSEYDISNRTNDWWLRTAYYDPYNSSSNDSKEFHFIGYEYPFNDYISDANSAFERPCIGFCT